MDLWQCPACSAWTHEKQTCARCQAPRPPAESVKYATFTARMQCVQCGGPLPLLGPQRAVHCDGCQHGNPISANEWGRILWAMAMGVGEANIGKHTVVRDHRDDWRPVCGGCKSPMPLDAMPMGTTTSLPCAQCSAAITSVPAPAWLVAELPDLLQLYGAALDPADGGIAPAGTAAEPASKGMVMSCPKCGGALDLGADTPRTTPCRFCSVDVYLPDDVWRRLHPVKTVRPWSVAYRGRALDTADTKRKTEREARERAEREAAKQATSPIEPTSAEPHYASATSSSSSTGAILFIIAALAVAGVIAAVVLL